MSVLRIRVAAEADLPLIERLVDVAITVHLPKVLTPQEVESSRVVMGVDRLLIADGTYFIAEIDGAAAGCGGWSRRFTLYGGDHTPGRLPRLLDPATEPARVRAMYTAPDFERRGVGKAILAAAESAARAEGFVRVQLAATLSGLPLYRACGYGQEEPFTDDAGGVPVPLVRMTKAL